MNEWFLFPVIVFLYMLGGQGPKGARRFGIVAIQCAYVIYKYARSKKFKWKYLSQFLLIAALSIGYGENSFYMKIFKKDWIVRIMCGATIAIPFLISGQLFSILALPVAFSIRAGGFKIGDKDFLWEDFIRGSSIAALICLNLGGI